MRNPEDYGARANLMWAGMIAHNGTCGVGCEEDWASHFLSMKSVLFMVLPTVLGYLLSSLPG